MPSTISVGSIAIGGILIPQDGSFMRSTEWGFDVGERRWQTAGTTPTSAYPQRNQRDAVYSTMYVREVTPRLDFSGSVELTVSYKGLLSSSGAVNKPRILPSSDVQMMSIGILSSNVPATLLAPIPQDTCTYEYVTTTAPSNQGVGSSASGAFLPDPAGFSITFVPDPNAAPPPRNNIIGWVLEDRQWEDVASKVWLVREKYRYYFTIN